MEHSKIIQSSLDTAAHPAPMLSSNAEQSAEPVYLTPEQLVERWNYSHKLKTLSNWRSKGYGPRYVKIGGRVLYPLEDVKAWEARQR